MKPATGKRFNVNSQAQVAATSLFSLKTVMIAPIVFKTMIAVNIIDQIPIRPLQINKMTKHVTYIS